MLESTQEIFEISIEMVFSASHIIIGHPGKCARLHGHNWTVEVSVLTPELNDIGLGIDFQDIKSKVTQLIDQLDHYHLNDLPYFKNKNPSAEEVCRFIYQSLEKEFEAPIKLSQVSLWETDRCCVRYKKSILNQ